tara:strand:+ start:386 stop:616 length:231 start_codon:yes stop_codon:yes gene_type:complete
MNKTLIIIGLVLGIGGLIFSLLPHKIHMDMFGGGMVEMDGEMVMDHHPQNYVMWGLIVTVVGFILALVGWKFLNKV